MLESLQSLDRTAFFFFNGLHSPWLDPVMYFLSKTGASLPVYALLLYLIIKTFGKQSWIVLLGVALTILLSDQITSGLMKPFFERLRPTHDPALDGLVHTVNGYRGGKFGFASSHAANTFGLAVLLGLLLRNHYRHIGWLFLWAALVSFTRIYLGVHYPGDILVGALVGLTCGYVVYRLVARMQHQISEKQKA
jgi:undecaprenyl-diphosphatase